MVEEIMNKHWQKFFEKFNEINDLKVSKWKEVHLLAYIVKRYKEIYEKDFSIEVKGAPSKSKNIYFVKNIYGTLGTSDSRLVKDYVDWVYDCIIKPQGLRFRSLNFFVNQNYVNDFKFARDQKKEIKRTTELPESYKSIASQLGIDLNTYGDLAFLKLSIDSGLDKTGNYKLILGNIEAMGFSLVELENIK